MAPLCFTGSSQARSKDASKTTANGEAVHDLSSLLDHLSTLTRNTIVFTGGERIDKLTLATPFQRRAFELVGAPIPTRIGPA